MKKYTSSIITIILGLLFVWASVEAYAAGNAVFIFTTKFAIGCFWVTFIFWPFKD